MSEMPPPPEDASPPNPAVNGPFRIGEVVAQGWDLYWQNLGGMLLLVLTLFAIEIGLGLVGAAFGGGVLGQLFQAFSTVVLVLLGLGVIRASLAVADGEPVRVGLLFVTDGWGPYLLASILVGLGVFVGLVLLVVPGVILALTWLFFGYVIAEEPTIGPTDALRRSADLTRGHRWQLLGLVLVLLLINLVGVAACCVGLFFTSGIAWVSMACAYKRLAGVSRAPA